ncbi:MAG: hypothetical protein EXR75_11540 [Myxococcales bacterium]|nr:hypothetical protein [Myxococcales bacterium]
MTHLRALATSLAALSIAFTTGCGGEYLYDDVDLTLDFGFTPSEAVNDPYVLGSAFTIRVGGVDNDESDPQKRTLASSNPSVLALSGCDTTFRSCSATAVAEGSAVVSAFDEDGDLVAEEELQVLAPDRVELTPHGREIVRSAAPAAEARILTGGTSTYLASYYRGATKLNGNGVLTATGDGVEIHVEQSFLFEDRDWLQLTPPNEGEFEVAVSASGLPMLTLPVFAVGADAVTKVQLVHAPSKHEPEEHESLTVLGEALDAEGRTVHGVMFSWDLDGDGQAGSGDLFRYEYVEDVEKRLGAEFSGLRAEALIHAQSGSVGTSNATGCTAAPAGSRTPLGGSLAVLGLAALAFVRSRRR